MFMHLFQNITVILLQRNCFHSKICMHPIIWLSHFMGMIFCHMVLGFCAHLAYLRLCRVLGYVRSRRIFLVVLLVQIQ